MDDAFDYLVLKQHGAIDTEAGYPYTGRAGTCAYEPARQGAAIGGWTNVLAGDEAALLDAVATVGPVSVAVDASIGWQLYFGGITTWTKCHLAPPELGSCGSSGRGWLLWAARHSQGRAPATGRPATASVARASRLQSR